MSISELSIRRPVFAWMLMAALILFGAISFFRMGMSQLPDVDSPMISISLTYDGAAPEVMETDIVDVIEDAVMAVEGIRSVTSYSRYGSASISLEFELDRNIDAAMQEVQAKVSQAQKKLPRDLDPPSFSKTNPEDQPILWLSVSSKSLSTPDLMKFVRDKLKSKFSTVSGVGEVFLAGYVEPNLRVWISNKKLNNYELTVGDVLDTISNEHLELPAGQIETSQKEYDVRTMGEAKNIEEFKKIVINQRGGRPNYNPIYLNQIATIENGLAEVRRLSRFNGTPAVGLGIKKQRGTNAVAVARAVKERMNAIKAELPVDTELSVNFDTTTFIEDSVHELNFTLVLSAILTALVCWFFLASVASTVNVLFAIPTSIIGSFIILHWLGYTLNTFTLLALSLAVGIVVDDAIMVLENIVRHRDLGKNKFQAALDGVKEISFAAMAATTAIVAIFLPVAFMQGVIGKFFLQFGVTMTVTVLLSLLEALTLTPMRCSQFMEAQGKSRFGSWISEKFSILALHYRRLLDLALSHRGKVVSLSVIFFAVSILSIRFLNKEFVPAQDQGRFLIRLQGPIGTSLSFTDEKFKEAEAILMKRPEIDRIYAAVGGFQGGDVNSGNIFVTMKDLGKRGTDPRKHRELTQQEFMPIVRQELSKIEGMKAFVQDLSMRGFSSSRGFPVEFSLRGPDWEKLGAYSAEIDNLLEQSGMVTDLDSDFKLGKPEIRIYPDREKASQYGVSIRNISETIRTLIGGVISGKYAEGGHRYDIRTRLVPEERLQADQIKSLFVRNNRGELVRLSDVIKIEEKSSLQQIARSDRERSIMMFGNVAPGYSQEKAIAEVKKIAAQVLPKDYRVVLSGSAQTFQESFGGLFFALILGLVVAYMVLGVQFNSFVDPITVLLALPFSISGAFLALWITGYSLNIYSFIGIILLMGIAKKNSILLVEFSNHFREQGMHSKDSLLTACPIRLRPILMTSFATIAGAIPAALAIGPGAETRVPMAIVVIGGMLVSTSFTLFVVPCAYSIFCDLRKGFSRDSALS